MMLPIRWQGEPAAAETLVELVYTELRQSSLSEIEALQIPAAQPAPPGNRKWFAAVSPRPLVMPRPSRQNLSCP